MGLFTDHPKSVGETYFQHFIVVFEVCVKLQFAVYAQLLHAVFPFIHPPLGLDVCSLCDYLESKKPDSRKQCAED